MRNSTPSLRLSRALAALFSVVLLAACGSGDEDPSENDDNGSEIDDDNVDDDDGVNADPDDDIGVPELAPTVVYAYPADGEVGVPGNRLLLLQFSQPMNITTVEGAFSTTTLPNLSFQWNDDNTMVNIIPDGGLEQAQGEGLDPSVVDAIEYEFTIDASATDANGVPLKEDISITFTTLKEMYGFLPTDGALTRTMLSSGVVHSVEHEVLYAGDSDFVADTQMKAFVTFDLTTLPTVVEITSASLRARQSNILGTPYETLGELSVDHVQFDALGQEAFDTEALASLGVLSADETIGLKNLDVTAAFAADVGEREALGERSQYCLSFASPHDEDDEGDSAAFDRDSFRLYVNYLTE